MPAAETAVVCRIDHQRSLCQAETVQGGENAAYLREGLKGMGFNVVESQLVTPVVPVVIGDDWQAVMFWKALYDAGVYTNVALYPAVPRGGALIRTSVMATHEREHLDRALAIFDKVRDSAQAGDPS